MKHRTLKKNHKKKNHKKSTINKRKARGWFWSSKNKEDPCEMFKDTLNNQEQYIRDLLYRIADLKEQLNSHTGINSRVEHETPKKISEEEKRRRINNGLLYNPNTKEYERIKI